MRFDALKNRFNKIMAAIHLLLLFICFLMSLSTPALADETGEYTLKSAFLYNFSLFATWPDQSSATFNLCIYGHDPFGKKLDILLQDKHVGQRPITIHRINQRDQLPQCQLVFISRSEAKNLSQIVDGLADFPVLTVADSPGACLQGVMLNMLIKHDKITFEANLTQARSTGLVLSSHLLRLAAEVY